MQTKKSWVDEQVSAALDIVAGPLEFAELSEFDRLDILHTYYQLRSQIAGGGGGSRAEASKIALYIVGVLPLNGGTE